MKNIEYGNRTYAIIHRTSEWKEGLDFLTPETEFIQAGTWWYQQGKELAAHRHLQCERTANLTQEVVIVISGRLGIDFYNEEDRLFHSEELMPGDLAIMLSGGHGYKMLDEQTKIVEVKNGPYPGMEKDRIRI